MTKLDKKTASEFPDAKTKKKKEKKKGKKAKALKVTPRSALRGEFHDQDLCAEFAMCETERQKLQIRRKALKRSSQRGIETWFRLTSRNLYTRRQIVDAKANMLVTINALILSVALSAGARFAATESTVTLAVMPIVVASLFSLVFAIIASRPQLRLGVFSQQDLNAHRVSLMTFDDFYAMSAEEYELAVNRIMLDVDLLYGTMKRDIYTLGVDLSRRYHHIRRAYGIFLFGICSSALLVIVSYLT